MKSKDERKAAFEAAGFDITKNITVGCMSGVTATIVYGALRDIASGNLSVYDGSWSQFSAAMK